MNILEKFPNEKKLLKWFKGRDIAKTLEVNNHIHTPYSFSAFDSIQQAISLAKDEGIQILGINDFFVRDGYEEFAKECYSNEIFPLFNIEFIALSKEDQKNNVRVNDPNNPGRTYLSGKGLSFPAKISEENRKKLEALVKESQVQVENMIAKLNDHMKSKGYDLSFSMDEMYGKYAKKLVRERHIATALRKKATEQFDSEKEQIEFFTKIFDGQAPKSDINNAVEFENEIRSKLLKAGGVAFVEEDEKAFLEVSEIRNLIIDMGGLPTYPLLLDDKNGDFTDFESDREKLCNTLKERGIFSIELIPHRNSFENLKKYVEYFYQQGFVVSFGTEHNTPALTKLKVECMNETSLDDIVSLIGYNGSAVIAAHQYLMARGKEGYLDTKGNAKSDERSKFELLGKAIIDYYFKQY